jgi:hypothetical protein
LNSPDAIHCIHRDEMGQNSPLRHLNANLIAKRCDKLYT